MKNRNLILQAFLLGLIALLEDGCTQKELNLTTPITIADKVEVVFDWSKSPDSRANAMMLYLYSEEHSVMNFWFDNSEGGTIKSYTGNHVAICHSNDDPYVIHFRNDDAAETFEILTENSRSLVGQGISTRGLPRAPGTEEEPLRDTPPQLYATADPFVTLRASALSQRLVLYPEEVVCHYSVEFVDVVNLKSADLRIDGTISSLAGGFIPYTMSPTSEAISHTFTLVADDALTSLRSNFLTFGVPAGEELPHKICVYIALKNRTGNFYTFDVSDQVNEAQDPRNVTIRIHGLTLPEIPDDPTPPDSPGETGMSVEVDNWNTIYYDIPVI